MRELVVISGKGGTGKTSVLAAFAALAEACVLADGDVDAADLHLVLDPTVRVTEPFFGGTRAEIQTDLCRGHGSCVDLCRFRAIAPAGPPPTPPQLDPTACEGCGVCAWFCPESAIEMVPARNGELYLSDTRQGPMVHARLGVAEENSGKLVTVVRERARALARQWGLPLVLVDGPPGIGCPVIASITGADLVLVVTEPTPSGLHDLVRVAELTSHFGIPTLASVNKWDLNAEQTGAIERAARRHGLHVAPRIPYDPTFTEAQIAGHSVVEHARGEAADAVRRLWWEVQERLGALEPMNPSPGGEP